LRRGGWRALARPRAEASPNKAQPGSRGTPPEDQPAAGRPPPLLGGEDRALGGPESTELSPGAPRTCTGEVTHVLTAVRPPGQPQNRRWLCVEFVYEPCPPPVPRYARASVPRYACDTGRCDPILGQSEALMTWTDHIHADPTMLGGKPGLAGQPSGRGFRTGASGRRVDPRRAARELSPAHR
jgi:hypothetical protein